MFCPDVLLSVSWTLINLDLFWLGLRFTLPWTCHMVNFTDVCFCIWQHTRVTSNTWRVSALLHTYSLVPFFCVVYPDQAVTCWLIELVSHIHSVRFNPDRVSVRHNSWRVKYTPCYCPSPSFSQAGSWPPRPSELFYVIIPVASLGQSPCSSNLLVLATCTDYSELQPQACVHSAIYSVTILSITVSLYHVDLMSPGSNTKLFMKSGRARLCPLSWHTYTDLHIPLKFPKLLNYSLSTYVWKYDTLPSGKSHKQQVDIYTKATVYSCFWKCAVYTKVCALNTILNIIKDH